MPKATDGMNRNEVLKYFQENQVTCVMIQNIPIRFSPLVVLNLLFCNDQIQQDPQIQSAL